MAKGRVQTNRKNFAWCIIPVCLFLVVLGMRLPELGNLHSAPKPRPRAVIETTSKSSHDAAVKKVVVPALCTEAVVLLPPKTFRLRRQRETFHYNSVAPPRSCARAPPFSC